MNGRERTQRQFWILEDDPPAVRPRWYCHGDMGEAPGFDDVDEAVAWGLARVDSVVVRTLGDDFYWAGQVPDDRDEIELKPWPPTDEVRRAIDASYAQAVADAEVEQAAYVEYQAACIEWLSRVAPELIADEPKHQCWITDERTGADIDLAEWDSEGEFCSGRDEAGRHAFGSAVQVISTLAGVAPDDPWLTALARALDRERSWDRGRRSMLDVSNATGEMFHVTAAANRDSINRYGLDWTRMGATPGIAGSRGPELPAVFLCEDLAGAGFFVRMARSPSDIWAVQLDGIWTEPGPDGWRIANEPIPRARLRLVETDIPVEPRMPY